MCQLRKDNRTRRGICSENRRKPDNQKARKPDRVERGCQPVYEQAGGRMALT
jgi:hypothetical protein